MTDKEIRELGKKETHYEARAEAYSISKANEALFFWMQGYKKRMSDEKNSKS